ncbi:transglutaminase family protein [Sphingomonas fuzhouensis]|uniref:transglutaminase family protein n=1 Tax=Sphingomonas fuzhouensis TaxID=3106033 RepID=UPI002AFFCAFC|nr:transglutaminase domain-containing protein [Sphingomonas sp. SGZ-02]
MRIAIEHQIVARPHPGRPTMVQMLRLTPENFDDQTVAHWRIDVDCDARLRHGQDGFGNAVTMLYIQDAPATVTITATGEVLTSDAHGMVRGTTETLPPALFLRATPATPADAAIARFAGAATQGTDGPLAALHALNAALHRRFASDARSPAADAAAAFAAESVGACDLAHIFCVAARSLGVPARFVSGFVSWNDAAGATAHCWAEAYVEGLGWIGFDPSIGLSPQDRHVRVAVALDAAGATTVSGEAWRAAVSEDGEAQ